MRIHIPCIEPLFGKFDVDGEIDQSMKRILEEVAVTLTGRKIRNGEETTDGVTKKEDGTIIVELPGAIKEKIDVTLDRDEIEVKAEKMKA